MSISELLKEQPTEQPKERTVYTIREKFLKDIIYVVLFALSLMSSCSGWTKAIESKSASLEKLSSTITSNTKLIENLTNEVSQVNDFLFIQQELNGKFKQFMSDTKRRQEREDVKKYRNY